MKSKTLFIEALESRIAPAILVNGGNLLGGNGNPTTGESSSGGNTVTLVKVLKGEALIFYSSANNGVITGISVGKHTKLDITGDIHGDIVTNLGPDGRLTDSDGNPANGEDGGILLNTSFKGLTTHVLGDQMGSVGRIIAGGSVSNIDVAGTLNGVYAGNGVFKSTATGAVTIDTGTVDYNTITPGLDHIFTLHGTTAKSTATPSITKVTVGTADQLQVFAGDGATSGSAGGSISNVTVAVSQTSDLATPAIFLHSGNGASGPNGGAGGAITQFNDTSSTSYVKLQTGDGGAATGHGGAGGSFTSSTINSNATRYEILIGNGGKGDFGGAGGSIKSVTFSDAVTGGNSLLATGDFTGDGAPDVLLVNTLTGNATLSAGIGASTNAAEAPFQLVLHPATGGGTTSNIAPVGSVPTDLLAVDVNGDNKLDYVVSYGSSDNLGVFINQGNGNFTGSSVALPSSPTRISAGDFTNSGHIDIAVLAAGSVPGGNGALSSQVYLAQGNGAGAFGTISAATTFSGVGTDLVSGQLDGAGGVDVVIGLKSGLVDTFLENGATTAAPFTLATTLKVFSGPISNLDINGTSILAFTVNSSANLPSTGTGTGAMATPTPLVQLLNVTSAGGLTSGIGFAPAEASPTAAHFIGSTSTIGVASSTAISIYTPLNNTYSSVASLTSDGALTDFTATVNGNMFELNAVGAASTRFFSTTGTLTDIGGIGTLLPFDIPGQPFVTNIQAGNGGLGTAHDGGAGGSIRNFTYTQTLGSGVEQAGARFDITFEGGAGGNSSAGVGGKGGGLKKVDLTLNPADFTGFQDSTTFAALSTGAGGNGATGGKGGNLTNITSNSVFDQTSSGGVVPNSVALQLQAGDGGTGTAGAGGNGGNIALAAKPALSGVSFFDPLSATPFAPGLFVESGNGGNGTTTGGTGGGIVNVQSQNATVGSANVSYNELASAVILSGKGGTGGTGTGGSGGAITGLKAAVATQPFSSTAADGTVLTIHTGGSLIVASGDGGASTRSSGGSGGLISTSTVASVDGDGVRDQTEAVFGANTDPYRGVGVLVTGGIGADGYTGGGNGGGIKKLVINSPSASDVYGAAIMGGDGGAATHDGIGGKGGSIHGVSQTKDVNSSLSVLQGGDGGAGAAGATGGKGGSVKNVTTVGFIGLPATTNANLGVFDALVDAPLISSLFDGSVNVPQGIFAGRGADGGAAGSVINVVARQIAAIGASVDANGVFGVAHAVTNVKADLIGYEVVRDNTFTSTTGHTSPATAKPIDGFILATTTTDIVTADSTRTKAFTFGGG